MFATFHCIAKRASRIRRVHPAGTALLARPGCPTLTGCGNFGAPVSGPFDGLTRSGLGRTSPFRDEGGKGLESERRAHYPASPKGRVTRGKRSFTLAAGPSAHAPQSPFPGAAGIGSVGVDNRRSFGTATGKAKNAHHFATAFTARGATAALGSDLALNVRRARGDHRDVRE